MATKKQVEDRLKKLATMTKEGPVTNKDIIKPKTTKEVKKPNTESNLLTSLRTEKKVNTSHKSVKIKTELYNDLKRIAEVEGLDSYGKLMTAILKDWITKYDSGAL